MIRLFKVAAIILLTGSSLVNAAEMEITASFAPSMSNPENNRFTNTTAQSGYCVTYPAQCSNSNVFSINFPVTATLIAAGIKANAEPRESVYFKMPAAWRTALLVNDSGDKAEVRFRVNAYSARYNTITDWNLSEHQAWTGGSFGASPPAPCMYSGVGSYGFRGYLFMWRWPAEDAACYKSPTVDRHGEPDRIDNMSIGYEIETLNPLSMSSGIYRGTLSLTVGPGGDFDFGDVYQASANNLTINFTLSVNHELQLTTTAEDRQVTLQPCAPGRVCTEEEGKANWERWMITRVPPQLSGRSNFNLSSSGAFTVFLQCGQQAGQDCALQSENSAQQVPVQALLTLPDNIVDQSSGATVSRRALRAGKDITQNIFNTRSFGENRKGSIDFVVAPKDVENMLKTRPDNYKGTVTVIFDPLIY